MAGGRDPTMEPPRTYESVILTNARLEGLLARLHLLSSKLEDPQSPLYFVTQAADPKINVLNSEKNFNESFPMDSRDLRKRLMKPHVDTLQEVAAITDTVLGVLGRLQEAQVHLDLNTNPSLALPALGMVASLTSLIILLFSDSGLAPARALPDIYLRLTQSNDDGLKVLLVFLRKFHPHPVDALQDNLTPFRDMLSTGVISAAKILDRGALQVKHQLENLVQSQSKLEAPDQDCAGPQGLAGSRDTLQPVHVARCAFLCFIAVGTPWDTRAKTGGYRVLESILTSGWLVSLQRDHYVPLHSTLINLIKRSKDGRKGAKRSQVEAWEKEALLKAPVERRDERRKLADLMEKYHCLVSDQPWLAGPRVLLLLTLLAHAAHEVNWLVLHQNGKAKKKMEKESEEAMLTGQETIRILFYIVELRRLLEDSADCIKAYTVSALQQEVGGLQEGEHLAALDLGPESRELLGKVVRAVRAIAGEERGGRLTVRTDLHRHDLGRLITALSCQAGRANSPAQTSPQLLVTLELVFLQSWLIQDPGSVARHLSNVQVLYFFQDTFIDYFEHLLRFDELFSYAIAFPSLCQDFPYVLQPDCPEENDQLISETTNMANIFTDKMATTAVKLIDSYCTEILKADQEVGSLEEAARTFHDRELEARRKEREKAAAEKGEKPKEKGRKRARTMKRKETMKRKPIFDTQIEKLTIGMKQLFAIFKAEPRLEVAGLIFRPAAALQEKLQERVLERCRALLRLEGRYQKPVAASVVQRELRSYQAALANIDPGLQLAAMFQEAIFSIRTEDPHPYIVKYCEKMLTTLSSPQCQYSAPHQGFLALTTSGRPVADPVEVMTSVEELQALAAIFGAEGMLWLGGRVREAMAGSAARVAQVLESNAALLGDAEARGREGAWRGLTQVPEFLEAAIVLGKQVALAELVDAANFAVNKERLPLLQAALGTVCASQQCQLLGVPAELLPIAAGLGYPQAAGQEEAEGQAALLVSMASLLLPLLARLETTRYYPHFLLPAPAAGEEAAAALEVHHSGLHCLAQALRHLGADTSPEAGPGNEQMVRAALSLPGSGRQAGGAALLALALLPQEGSGVPDSLGVALRRAAMLDTSPASGLDLHQELASKKTAKLLKK